MGTLELLSSSMEITDNSLVKMGLTLIIHLLTLSAI